MNLKVQYPIKKSSPHLCPEPNVCLVHALSFCLLKALANIAFPYLFHTASFTTYRDNIT